MARAATTTDVFNAVAEQKRRQILVFLAADEKQVNEIVEGLRLGQHRQRIRREGAGKRVPGDGKVRRDRQ